MFSVVEEGRLHAKEAYVLVLDLRAFVVTTHTHVSMSASHFETTKKTQAFSRSSNVKRPKYVSHVGLFICSAFFAYFFRVHTYYDYFYARFYCLLQSSSSLLLLLLSSRVKEKQVWVLEWLRFGWGENGRLSLGHVNIKGWNASLFLFVCDFSENNFINFLLLLFLANEFFGRRRHGCWIIMIFLILKHVTQFYLLISYI